MKYALVNPRWSFEGSTYFGCPEPHFPLELLYAQQTLRECGARGRSDRCVHGVAESGRGSRSGSAGFDEDFLVMPTAPSYLFWRCPQPELRVPRQWFAALERRSAKVVDRAAWIRRRRRQRLQRRARTLFCGASRTRRCPCLLHSPWETIDGCCWRDASGTIHMGQGLGVTDMRAMGTLDYSDYPVELHAHKHHVFPGQRRGSSATAGRRWSLRADVPYSCTFCNKTLFRNKFRERELGAVIDEMDQLIARGVDYIYFIDEIFGVGKNVRTLLEEIAKRPVSIGFQSRIDLWNEETLDLLGRAHCVSFECGVESVTEEGRDELNKNCKLTTDRIGDLLIYARTRIPWVQANLIKTEKDDAELVRQWQSKLKSHGVWVSEPVPMFPFPGSPLYVETFGDGPG